MAKYECRLKGSFTHFLQYLDQAILQSSISASYEEGSDYCLGETRCAVRVYERYSVTGSNRVSLSVTLLGKGEELMLCAITSGGSQAAFFKINTWGEEAFLEQVERAVHNYERRNIR